jgi:hypothetical protein
MKRVYNEAYKTARAGRETDEKFYTFLDKTA